MKNTYYTNLRVLIKYWKEHYGKDLQDGYITGEQVKYIKETLELDTLNEWDLQNLYDLTSAIASSMTSGCMLNKEFEKYQLFNDFGSAVKEVIHQKIYSLHDDCK